LPGPNDSPWRPSTVGKMLVQDIRYAVRLMRLNLGFTAGVVLVLALGIGVNTAIFTVVNAVLFEPLPYTAPDRLVRLYEHSPIGTGLYNVVSPANFLDWEGQATSFIEIAANAGQAFNLSGDNGELPERLTGAICSYNLFSTLGVQPALGRAPGRDDDRPEASRVVVISHGLWQRRFGGLPRVVGSPIRLDGESYTVVGVMPPGFDFPSAETQAWAPMFRNISARAAHSRGSHRYDVVGRLRPGVSVAQAGVELDGIARRIRQQNPNEVTGPGATVASLQERTVFRVRLLLLVLLGAVGCVLLIACVNVTNLLLARAIARRREAAIRTALGAGRWQLFRQFLTESTLLSGFGALLGLLLAKLGVKLLLSMTTDIPRTEAAHVSASVLLFTLGVAALTGVVVGLAPAFSCLDLNLASAIHDSSRSATGSRRRKFLGDALVATEVALSLILLIGSGLLLKSFARLRGVDPGFATERLLTMRFSLPASQYKNEAQRTAFYENLVARVRPLPGVTAAGMVTILPVTGHLMDNTFTIVGRPPLPPGQFLDAVLRAADPGYFQAMGIPLKRGRTFSSSDRLDKARLVIISESMARQFFKGEDPLGQRIKFGGEHNYEIVGIVGDVRKDLAEEPEPTMYAALLEGNFNFAALAVRTAGNPNALALPIQREVSRIDSDLPVVSVLTMDEVMSRGASQRRSSLVLLGIFAGLATILAAIGLYGLLAYSIRQRTGELGIRIALGARPMHVIGMVLAQGLRPAAAGVLAGLAIACAVASVLQSLLFEVKPLDMQVFFAVALLLMAIAALACAIPARRATRIDPAVALRTE
jgi:predicted permease